MAKTIFQLTEGSAPQLTDYALTGEDPAGIHVLRRTTWQSIKNLFMSGVTSRNDNDWIPVTGTWAYATATTITVPTGAASIYSVGDKFKLTSNGSLIQGYIVAVADTLLTVAGDALTNYTFSANYYSHGATPVGFPHWFNYTPVLTAGNTDLSGFTTAKFAIDGRTVSLVFLADNKTLSGTAGYISISLPVTAVTSISFWGTCAYFNGTAYAIVRADLGSSVINVYKGLTSETWAANETGLYFRISGSYEI